MKSTRITIGGLPIDCMTQGTALRAIDACIEDGRGGFVVTPNIDHVVTAQRHAGLRAAYGRARISLADGQPLLWMARALGTPLPEKVSGSDLIEPLMAMAADRGRRVFFFGATPEVSAEAGRRLTLRYPRLQIVGRDCSFWSVDTDTPASASPVVHAVRAANTDLLVVALGSPKQELWMARHASALAPAVSIGLGASLDFVAGTVRRSPAWMSRAGLEWLYRLAQEPRRLAYRYLVRDLQVLPIFGRDLLLRFTEEGRR